MKGCNDKKVTKAAFELQSESTNKKTKSKAGKTLKIHQDKAHKSKKK